MQVQPDNDNSTYVKRQRAGPVSYAKHRPLCLERVVVVVVGRLVVCEVEATAVVLVVVVDMMASFFVRMTVVGMTTAAMMTMLPTTATPFHSNRFFPTTLLLQQTPRTSLPSINR